jgi:NitT/TauT family transport system substrate-binding protein
MEMAGFGGGPSLAATLVKMLPGLACLAAAVLSAGMPPAFAQAAPIKEVAIKIASTRSASNAPFLIAQERGYFTDEGLAAELVFLDSAGPITAAVMSGDVDFGATGLSAAFYNLAGQGAMRIIAGHIYDFPGFRSQAVVASNQAWESGLRSFKDLPGHSVAVTQVGTPLHYSVGLLAQKFGFDIKSVRILPLQSFPNAVSAVVGGSADAAVVSVTYVLPAIDSGQVKLLGYLGEVTPTQVGAVFTATRTANDRRDVVERFLRAFRRAARDYHDALTGPDGKLAFGPGAPTIIAIMAKASGQTQEQVKDGIGYIDAEGRLDVSDILRQIAWYKSQGMIKGEIDGNTIIDKTYVIPLPAR